MKKTIALAAIAIVLLACESPGEKKGTDPCQPGGCQVNAPVDEKGDGIWNVGDELRPGLWSLDDSWKDTEKYPNCVWFVAPASAAPSASVEPTSTRARVESPGTVTIRLHKGEHLTSSGCPKWKRVGD